MTRQRILITALGHIADSLGATPVIRALRRAHPDARITVLAYEEFAPLWIRHPEVDEVITTADRRHGGYWGAVERLREMAKLTPRIWRRFDLVVVLQLGRQANMLAALSGAPRRVGFDHGWSGRLMTTAVPLPDGLTFRDANLAVLRALGIEDADPRMTACASAPDHQAATTLVERLTGDGTRPLVGLHPGADWGCQMWGFGEWAEVGDYLVERWNARVVITGTASERWIAERITKRMRHSAATACGETSLTELTALIERMDLLVAVNSGPAAVSVAVATPVVILNPLYYGFEDSLWGRLPGDEVVSDIVVRDDGQHRWYGDSRLRRLRRERHCVNPACIGRGVMGTIAPATVIRTIDERLSARTRPVLEEVLP